VQSRAISRHKYLFRKRLSTQLVAGFSTSPSSEARKNRQWLDEPRPAIAKLLTRRLRFWVLCVQIGQWAGLATGCVLTCTTRGLWGFGALAQFPHRAHGRQRARDDLCGARALGAVVSLGLEQLGVCEHHAKLIVQPVEERLQIWVRGLSATSVGGRPRRAHACDPTAVLDSCSSERVVDIASRQSVSAKIRIEPPAVRTYSTFPAAIQL